VNSEFLPEAEEEFREAARYYETEAPGIGVTFVAEVRRAVRAIIKNPHAAAPVGSGIRRHVLKHFPYNILYAVEEDLLVIIAVAHQKRRPRYWGGRIARIKARKDSTRD
jgi:plasmid stabilization system protein ParE